MALVFLARRRGLAMVVATIFTLSWAAILASSVSSCPRSQRSVARLSLVAACLLRSFRQPSTRFLKLPTLR